MRSLLNILLGFAVLISFSVFTYKNIEMSYQTISTNLEQVQKYIADEQWDDAEKVMNEVDSFWSKTENSWAILLDHEALDDIEISIKKLEKYIETKEKPSSLAELETLKVLIKKIIESESLKLNNIL